MTAPVAVGTAQVATDPPQAPVPPPPSTAPIDEALRWLGTVAAMSGPPDGVDVSASLRRMDVFVSSQQTFSRWGSIVGGTVRTPARDVLGGFVTTEVVHQGYWSVRVHIHVSDRGQVTR